MGLQQESLVRSPHGRCQLGAYSAQSFRGFQSEAARFVENPIGSKCSPDSFNISVQSRITALVLRLLFSISVDRRWRRHSGTIW
jgi:hypothetical protein